MKNKKLRRCFPIHIKNKALLKKKPQVRLIVCIITFKGLGCDLQVKKYIYS
jgi:hypothetical protein